MAPCDEETQAVRYKPVDVLPEHSQGIRVLQAYDETEVQSDDYTPPRRDSRRYIVGGITTAVLAACLIYASSRTVEDEGSAIFHRVQAKFDATIAAIAASTAAAAHPIRLAGWKNSHGGVLEVYHEGEWGTVCIPCAPGPNMRQTCGFRQKEAKVICRNLGYAGGDVIYNLGATTPSVASKIWLDGLSCSGNETAIAECKHSEWGKAMCAHNQDVGIQCEETEVGFMIAWRNVTGSFYVTSDEPGKLCMDRKLCPEKQVDEVEEAFKVAIAYTQKIPKKDVTILGSQISGEPAGIAEILYNVTVPGKSTEFKTFNIKNLTKNHTEEEITERLQKIFKQKKINIKVKKVHFEIPLQHFETYTTTTTTTRDWGKVFTPSKPAVCQFMYKGDWQLFLHETCLPAFRKAITDAQDITEEAIIDLKTTSSNFDYAQVSAGIVGDLNVTFQIGMSLFTPLAGKLESKDLFVQKKGSATEKCCIPADEKEEDAKKKKNSKKLLLRE